MSRKLLYGERRFKKKAGRVRGRAVKEEVLVGAALKKKTKGREE